MRTKNVELVEVTYGANNFCTHAQIHGAVRPGISAQDQRVRTFMQYSIPPKNVRTPLFYYSKLRTYEPIAIENNADVPAQ